VVWNSPASSASDRDQYDAYVWVVSELLYSEAPLTCCDLAIDAYRLNEVIGVACEAAFDHVQARCPRGEHDAACDELLINAPANILYLLFLVEMRPDLGDESPYFAGDVGRGVNFYWGRR
jgi:hypothetical protein